MSNETTVERAERAMNEFRRELSATEPDAIDLLAVERRT